MEGRDEIGQYVTTSQSRYPSELCKALAASYLAAIRAKPIPEAEEKPLHPVHRWIMQRVPPVGPGWDPLPRWHELFRTKWRHQEHNNIGEMRISYLGLRHLSRSSRAWNKRALFISDSLVTIGVQA